MERKQFKRQNGITLIALVVTIIVLIILAGIAISMTVGNNGIFAKAKEAKRLQITAEAKEKIGAEILDAQVETTQKNEQLQQSKVEEIIAKYGELQADGDTIKLKDNGYEISLKEIYNGETSSTGGSTSESTSSEPVLLWQNPNPTNNFVTQTLNIDFSKYNFFVIKYRYSTGESMEYYSLGKVNGMYSNNICNKDTLGAASVGRWSKATSSSIFFDTGTIVGIKTDDSYAIPLEIYGVNINL